MRTTSIRFTGLASGLDTESIIEGMTISQKMKVDSSKQAKLLLDLQKEKQKEISQRVNKFMLDFSGKLRFASGFDSVKATSSDTSAVDIKGVTTAGTHTIDKVTQLASSAKLNTTSIGVTSDTTLKELNIAFKDGEDVVLKVSDGVDKENKPIIKEIKLTEGMTIAGLEKELKSKLTNSNVSFDNTAKGFFISSKQSGKSQAINIQCVRQTKDEDGNIIEENFDDSVMSKLGLGDGKGEKGKNAIITYNGMLVESESNTVSINGVEFTVKKEFDKPVTINAEQNTEDTFNTIKSFIEEYNKLISDLNTMIEAKPNRDYKPLTDEQKKDMSEEEIKMWNKKIEDSLFSGDNTLKKLVGDLRNTMSTMVDGMDLNKIGISSTSWKDKGVLTIDENKLREAINTNAGEVIKIFAGDGTIEGVADKMHSSLTEKFKSIANTKTAASIFNDIAHNKKIDEESKKTTKLEEQLLRMEDMYYKKFTAMEKMLQQLNSQSSWLSGQLGSM